MPQAETIIRSYIDKVVENLRKNFSEGTEYFQLLVEVFSSRFGSSKHAHLRRFYAIVLPLTVNYVDHVVAAKEKIGKKRQLHQQQDKVGMGGGVSAFTDDGFAMGLAYILRLLDQGTNFGVWSLFPEMYSSTEIPIVPVAICTIVYVVVFCHFC